MTWVWWKDLVHYKDEEFCCYYLVYVFSLTWDYHKTSSLHSDCNFTYTVDTILCLNVIRFGAFDLELYIVNDICHYIFYIKTFTCLRITLRGQSVERDTFPIFHCDSSLKVIIQEQERSDHTSYKTLHRSPFLEFDMDRKVRGVQLRINTSYWAHNTPIFLLWIPWRSMTDAVQLVLYIALCNKVKAVNTYIL